jgi:ATP-binding cassette subfamily F protein 3
LITLSNISIQFGARKLFDGVSFIINTRDRIGLVGANGTGKSTLLKILTRLQEADSGEIIKSKHVTVDYLPQDGLHYTGNTLYEEVYSSLTDVNALKSEIDEVTEELSHISDKDSEEYLDLVLQLGELQEKFSDMDGFKIKPKIEKILEGLGFETKDFTRLTDEFSGGWQMRIALAKLLLKNPSVLLLDEPTNHLDLDSLLWLETFLRDYKGAVVLVSHDRQFLDNMTRKTIEISLGKVTIYPGNYSHYITGKQARIELTEKRYFNQQRYLKQQERFIERFRYKKNKASVVQSRIKMLEKLERIELEDHEQEIHFQFPPATHSGKLTIELKNITKSYGSNLVLKDIDLLIERGEKIGLVGKNGAGKSTLARIIRGTEDFQKGIRKMGHRAELEFYSQQQADSLDAKNTVLETLDSAAIGDIRKHLRTLLGSFLFKGDDVFKPVGVLSGGEKSRLALALMLLKPSNFLILDEPTNHLDMNSKKILMRALMEYEGTILIISHDREFLDGIVNKIIEVKDHRIKTYGGNCSYYIAKIEEELLKQENIISSRKPSETGTKKIKEHKRTEAELRNKLYRLSKPHKDLITKLENDIFKSEARLKEIEEMMMNAEFYKDSKKIKETNSEFGELKKKLNELYNKWEEEQYRLREIEELINES